MAVARKVPTCPYCKKPIAKAVYRNDSNSPWFLRKIGDSFIRWEYTNHSCKGTIKAEKENKKWIKKYMKDHPEFKETIDKLKQKK